MELTIEQWKNKGSYFTYPIGNHKIYYQDIGKPNSSPNDTLLILHGFPESSYSFHKVTEALEQRFDRIVVFDFIGFGLSDKPPTGYDYSILDHADTAVALWQHIGVNGGHLLCHDMGDSVGTELIYRVTQNKLAADFSNGFSSATFTNGSMVIQYADLRITQKILLSSAGPLLSKISSKYIFSHQIKSAHGNENLTKEDIDSLWKLVNHNKGKNIMHLLIQYYNDRRRYETSHWIPALSKIDIPIHFCWGDDDQVAPLKIAEYLKQKSHNNTTLSIMNGVGHFGQIGNPEKWSEGVLSFYEDDSRDHCG